MTDQELQWTEHKGGYVSDRRAEFSIYPVGDIIQIWQLKYTDFWSVQGESFPVVIMRLADHPSQAVPQLKLYAQRVYEAYLLSLKNKKTFTYDK